ncbi:DUF3124 domain-containing protein [Magnetospirillum sp. UT-4]|uniref:DUF3124 domain-containing protein n=1 Tax=Magnetospirillum sp. UT-4 TaxID=2681467 RepID=UPI001384A985|nr:DUF3124 domain-containing protein [Magnetospirillum sp. UT-4]CAA7615136.1 conserved exported hypothetical protein [Magnetospirillum sp. UT-4]
MRALVLAAALFLATLPAMADPLESSRGQTVYVPVYSHIWHGNLDSKGQPQMLLLSSMLSVRNTDPDDGLIVRSVRYYDTAGKLLREYMTQPARLGAMASTDVFVEHKDDAGGAGANFLVVWSAERPINPPIIETVNAYFFGPHSLAFTSPGKVIAEERK